MRYGVLNGTGMVFLVYFNSFIDNGIIDSLTLLIQVVKEKNRYYKVFRSCKSMGYPSTAELNFSWDYVYKEKAQ